MKGRDGFVQRYNAHAAVDTGHQVNVPQRQGRMDHPLHRAHNILKPAKEGRYRVIDKP